MLRNGSWLLIVLLASAGVVKAQGGGTPSVPPRSVQPLNAYPAFSPPPGYETIPPQVIGHPPYGTALPPSAVPPGSVVYPATGLPVAEGPSSEEGPSQPWTFEAEYLLWWVRDGGQISNGLVGSATVADYLENGGRLQNIMPLDQASSHLDFGAQSGLRLTLTHYLDELQGIGFDVSWMSFLRGELSERFTSSDSLLLGPTFNDTDGARVLVLASFPSTVTINGQVFTQGRSAVVSVETANRLWGVEANGRVRLPSPFFFDRIWMVGGVRGFQYGEGFSVETLSTPLPGNGGSPIIELRDSFIARNLYVGPQIGLNARTQIGCLSLDLIGKTSLGAMCEEIKINGETITTGASGVNQLVGGVLAQRSNIGTVESTRMAWVNELSIKGGWNFNNSLRATVGYSLLHANRMVRLAGAVDTVDSRSVQVLSSYDPTLTAAQPGVPALTESYWWAQGFTFGVDWSF